MLQLFSEIGKEGLFFVLKIYFKPLVVIKEVAKCVQELLWHVQNANSVTTILKKTKKRIRTEWKQRNIADSVRDTHYTKKPNNCCNWQIMSQ